MKLFGHGSVFQDVKNYAHNLPEKIASMAKSEAFEFAMQNANEYANTKAYLTIQALKGIALSPHWCKSVSDIVLPYDDCIGFNVDFHGMVNFIGYFELPLDSPFIQQLNDAINENFASEMYAAAKSLVVVRSKHQTLLRQHEILADAAYKEVMKKAGELKQFSPFSLEHEVQKEKRALITEEAKVAYEQVMGPKREELAKKLRDHSNAANPGFKGMYTEAVAKFLYQHLPFTGVNH